MPNVPSHRYLHTNVSYNVITPSTGHPRFNPRFLDHIARRLKVFDLGKNCPLCAWAHGQQAAGSAATAATAAAAGMIWYMVLMDSSCLKNPWTLAFCGGAISPHHDDGWAAMQIQYYIPHRSWSTFAFCTRSVLTSFSFPFCCRFDDQDLVVMRFVKLIFFLSVS